MKTDYEITCMLDRELKAQGITYARMAKLLGVSETWIKTRMHNTSTVWTLDSLTRWCEILGLKAEMVFVRTSRPTYLARVGKWRLNFPETYASKREIDAAVMAVKAASASSEGD